ncbi:hypothetical protein D3C72_1729590 [compost metagenome]
MGAEGVLEDLQPAVVEHLGQRRGLAQVAFLQGLGVVVQLAVVAHAVQVGVAALQPGAEAIAVDQLADLLLQGLGVAGKVLQGCHGRRLGPGGWTSMMAPAIPQQQMQGNGEGESAAGAAAQGWAGEEVPGVPGGA